MDSWVVIERNRPDDTFGWGVVLSDETLANLEANDAESAALIRESFVYWDDIAVHYRGETMRSGGHGFSGGGPSGAVGASRRLSRAGPRGAVPGVCARAPCAVPGGF